MVTVDEVHAEYPKHEQFFDLKNHINALKYKQDTVGVAFWNIVASGVLDHPYWKDYFVAMGTPIIKLLR